MLQKSKAELRKSKIAGVDIKIYGNNKLSETNEDNQD